MMMVVPGVTRPGGRCAAPASLLDLYPTLVELTGGTPPASLEGTSLVPLLHDPDLDVDRPVSMSWLEDHAVRSRQWRYIRYADGSEELYDHEADPAEYRNLAGDKSFDETKRDLARWLPEVKIPYRPE